MPADLDVTSLRALCLVHQLIEERTDHEHRVLHTKFDLTRVRSKNRHIALHRHFGLPIFTPFKD